MSNVASLELCKELYELSGWEPLDYGVLEKAAFGHPVYDLSYLLRKLARPHSYGHDIQLTYTHDLEHKWQAAVHYIPHTNYVAESCDTPEDAACKLAIELFKQGVLKRDQSNGD